MKFVFAQNINGTGESGIIDMESLMVICICPETNAELLIKALELHNRSIDTPQTPKESIEAFTQ